MLEQVRRWLRISWPFVGSLYLVYLAVQPPPVRYVGVIGLAFVLPLLAGWIAGRLFGVGPWADGDGDAGGDDAVDADGNDDLDDASD